MNDQFKSNNYKKNLDSLIKAINLREVKKINEQYNETVRDLSQALEDFTDKAEDVAKFVIHTDLNNYREPVNKRPPGLFETFKGILSRILGKDIPIKNNDIRNFANDKLPSFTLEKAAEYTNILRRINLSKGLKEALDLRHSKKIQEEHKSYEVNLKSKAMPKQKEDASELQKKKQLKVELDGNLIKRKIKRPTMPPPPPPPPTAQNLKKISSLEEANPSMNELKSESQKKVATIEKNMHFKSEIEITPSDSKSELSYIYEDSGYESLLGEEHEYEEISNFQEKKSEILTKNSQNSKSPKEEPIYATVSKEHIEAKRERKQKQQSKPLTPSKPPRASLVQKKMFAADQEIKQESKVVTKNKPEVLPKPKNSAHRQSVKAVSEVIPKEVVNCEMGSKVKTIREKFEPNLSKESTNVWPAKSKTTTAAQVDVSVKKKIRECSINCVKPHF